MKKLLITLLAILATGTFTSVAANVIVDYQGDTTVNTHVVERRLILNNNEDGVYDIALKPLDNALRSSDGKVAIPLNYLFINNNREDVYLRYNEYSTIFNNLAMNGVPYQITARVRDYGMIPAGTYGLSFEVQATDTNAHQITGTSMFYLQLIVPPVQKLSAKGESSRITVGADDVMKGNKRINNDVSPTLYINSNTDWVLIARTDDFDSKQCDYYIRTISASADVKERLQDRVLVTPSKEIILAKGKAPANGQFVTIEYSIETRGKGCIRAGNYLNKIRYILREDKG